MKDLLGQEITEEEARAKLKRRDPEPQGYAAPPGTGPEGQTCGTCDHADRQQGGGYPPRSWAKCELERRRWTGGRKTDIRLRAPACRLWKGSPE